MLMNLPSTLPLSVRLTLLKTIGGGAMLVTALSIDALAASFGYGASKVKIPFLSALIISLISSATLILSLLFGSVIGRFLPIKITTAICISLLFLIALMKLWDSFIKGYIRRHQTLEKNIRFNFLSLRFILKIYADPLAADKDKSKILSIKESISLALALSLDSLAVGVGTGLMKSNIPIILILSISLSLTAIYFGGFLGRKLAAKSDLNLSWISGVILLLLAVFKLLS